ncbi:MAG: C25 family peptidase propeptide domain-containing protein [Flavobacterium sp.]
MEQFDFKDVETQSGLQKTITASNLSAMMKADAPDLPKLATALIIPDQALMEFEILNSTFLDYPEVVIAPSKGNLSRQVNPSTVPFKYGRAYETDAFYPNQLAQFDSPYILRDVRGQNLQLFPFQYNPVTKVLRVYNEIKIRVFTTSNGGENKFTRTKTINLSTAILINCIKNNF